jgi:hypothetical protein
MGLIVFWGILFMSFALVLAGVRVADWDRGVVGWGKIHPFYGVCGCLHWTALHWVGLVLIRLDWIG